MLEGFTKEELFEMKWACIKKYEKLENETIKKALTGEIGTNMKMVEALEDLNRRYQDEMEQFELYTSDLNPQTIENFKAAEERGENVIQCARMHLEISDIIDKAMTKTVYKNDDGQICDEYGVPLSNDGEHRVFETIKGGGKDDDSHDTFCNPTTLGVVKGGREDD